MSRRCGIDACRNKLGLKPTGCIRTSILQNLVGTDKPGTSHSEPNTAVTDLMRKKVEMAECAQEQLRELKTQESLLPKGTILTKVAGVVLAVDDVGLALQFLEHCRAFSLALGIKDGQPKSILEEIANQKEAGSSSRLSDLAKLQTDLLARIPTRGRVEFKQLIDLLAQEQYEQNLLGLKEELREACCEMLDALKDVDLEKQVLCIKEQLDKILNQCYQQYSMLLLLLTDRSYSGDTTTSDDLFSALAEVHYNGM